MVIRSRLVIFYLWVCLSIIIWAPNIKPLMAVYIALSLGIGIDIISKLVEKEIDTKTEKETERK